MAHWLFKSEPSVWSFADQLAAGEKGTEWSGVRNHAAKLNLTAQLYDPTLHFDQVKDTLIGVRTPDGR